MKSSLGHCQNLVSGAKEFEIVLLPGSKVALSITFVTLYEAAVAFEAFSDAVKAGQVSLTFNVSGEGT